MGQRDTERAAYVAAMRAQGQFAAKLRRIAEQATATRSSGFWVPVTDSDPSADFPGNMWAFDDGRVRWRGTDGTVHELQPGFPLLSLSSNPAASSKIDIYRHSSTDELRVRRPDGTWARYASIAAASSGDSTQNGSNTGKVKQPDPSPKKRRATWSATWGKSFNSVRGPESSSLLRYGRYDSTWGNRRIMVGFNDSDIRATLAGASIRSVELHMTNTDSWSHAGIDVHWGAHNRTSPPGGFSSVRRNAFVGHWPDGGDGPYWRTVSDWFGRALRDNQIKGLTIDQPDGQQFYGQMRWSSVRLRITYTS